MRRIEVRQPSGASSAARWQQFAVVAFVLCVGFAIHEADASAQRLFNYPHLRCSACEVIAQEIGQKMNDSAHKHRFQTHQVSHRFTKDNKVKKVDYESSELRAIEILDDLCKNVESKYGQLRECEDKIRRFTNNYSLPAADHYSAKDKDELENIKSHLVFVCNEVVEEHYDSIVGYIRKDRVLDDLTTNICTKTAKVCNLDKMKKWHAKELAMRAKWHKRQEAKAERQRKKKEEAEQAEQAKIDANKEDFEKLEKQMGVPENQISGSTTVNLENNQAPTAAATDGAPPSSDAPAQPPNEAPTTQESPATQEAPKEL